MWDGTEQRPSRTPGSQEDRGRAAAGVAEEALESLFRAAMPGAGPFHLLLGLALGPLSICLGSRVAGLPWGTYWLLVPADRAPWLTVPPDHLQRA